MNSEKLRQFLIPILIVIATFGMLFMLLSKDATNIQNIMNYNNSINQMKQELAAKQEKLAILKKKAEEDAKKEEQKFVSEKAFYKPIASGLSTEAVIVGEFNEILELIRVNKIKVRSMKSDYDPQDDEFVKGAGAEYNVARLNLEMVTDYTSFSNFMKELYKHDHFLDIESVEIVPYKKNKQILLINFKIKLYAKK